MNTEASTRRAVEKCMSEIRLVRFLFFWEDPKTNVEMLVELDRCAMVAFLYLSLVESQATHTTERKRTIRTEATLDMGPQRVMFP